MALGKYTRVDNRRSSSSYCSTVSMVVFVAFCLLGVWMMTSSSVVPVENVDSGENKNGVREQAKDSNSSSNKQFDDNPGELPTDVIRGDNLSSTESESRSNDQEMQNNFEKSEEVARENVSKDNSSEDTSKKEADNLDSKNTDGEMHSEESRTVADVKQSDSSDSEKKSGEMGGDTVDAQVEKQQENQDKDSVQKSGEQNEDDGAKKQVQGDVFLSGAQSEILNESTVQNGSFSTQAAESKNEKEVLKSSESQQQTGYNWKVCNVSGGPDYIPCLDNVQAIRKLRSTKHYEHRERQCPELAPTCLVALPKGYKRSIAWPTSREKIWYNNVPHTQLAEYKGHQNWVKVSGEYLTFPGGGTQFQHGALHYIEFIEKTVPNIAWGKRTRVVLDVGCGVASFGGYLFEKDVLTMSFAPKDEHEAQVQFALERGIPAISAVMGTKRLPYPGRVFDVLHCARCRVPWHIEGGKLLLELNRVLRPGGFFVWSATPVYLKLDEDVQIWNAMKELTKSMCWELVAISKDKINKVGVAIYRKPVSNECYEKRSQNKPPFCQSSDDPNAAWNVPLQSCIHKLPAEASERGSQWPEEWPARLQKPPYWLTSSQVGVYGKAAPEDLTSDYEHWKRVVSKSYLNGMGISWSSVRNIMDMRAVYGGFAAALRDLNVWVMNVVTVDSPDTLPIIYERGLFGIYHDWCESFSTYPRTYDLLHADHLFSKIKKKCNLVALVAEVDRILRPEGKLIVRDTVEVISELENLMRSLQWEIRMTYTKNNEGLLCVQKSFWRPKEVENQFGH